MQWFKSKKGQNKQIRSQIPSATQTNSLTPELKKLMHDARGVLQEAGVTNALEFLGKSPYSDSEPVLRMMHNLAYRHQDNLSNINTPYLDRIFCQCSVCDSDWLIPPGYWCDQPGDYTSPITGLECSSCGKVFCPQCSKAIYEKNCQCGNTFSFLHKPNGRRAKQETTIKDRRDLGIGLPRRPEAPIGSNLDLHLYYGYEGKVQIGIDLSFPMAQTHSAETHLIWAETLLDVGVFYQAQQQLDLLSEEGASSARALWLRSRLELVKFHNDRERHKRKKDLYILAGGTRHLESVLKWLTDATNREPDFAPVWPMLAQVYLYSANYQYDDSSSDNLNQAYRCALCAQKLLGNTPAVLLVLGETLYRLEQYSEALTILRQIPEDSEERNLAKKTLELAELKAHSQLENIDIEVLWQLGRQYLRQDQYGKARELFTRLHKQYPNRPEGYYGLAMIKLFSQSMHLGRNEGYQLCKKAISLDPNFGPAYELLGNIFGTIYNDKVDFPIEDPIPYYQRAVELDSTCDFALWQLAEKYIDEGKLEPALDALEQAAALDTNISTVYFILEVIYKGLRQFDKVILASNKANEKSPDTVLSHEKVQKIRKRLKFDY